MDNKFQTSFIPKKPVVTSIPTKAVKHPPNLLSVIGAIIFFLTLCAAGAVFYYPKYLDGKLSQKNDELQSIIQSFSTNLVEEWGKLDTKIESSKMLLNRRVAFTSFLDVLESLTTRSISFRDISFTATANGFINVAMKGSAASYSAVAYQADVFNQTEPAKSGFKSMVFSNVSVDDRGNVIFNFSTVIDPKLVGLKAVKTEPVPSTLKPAVSTTTPPTGSKATTTKKI